EATKKPMVTLEELQKSTAQRVEAGGAGRMKAAAAGGSTQCQESSGRHAEREGEREGGQQRMPPWPAAWKGDSGA
ncbi:hypothetical protein CHARACLAT_012064, partial [Characodon lateralis]|nr:hypothetical protein [Characodon lateralis]